MNGTWLSPENSRWVGFAALATVIAGNALGNLLLKLGADARRDDTLLFGFANWQTLTGVGCFAFGILAYSWALKQFDLHVAQFVVSLQYVVVILLASWVLGENISLSQWLGMGLIALGIFICLR